MTDALTTTEPLYISDADLIRRMGVHGIVFAVNWGVNDFNALFPNGRPNFFDRSPAATVG
jgi:hypothetical protein